MLFEIALIIVTMGLFSFTWALLEILFFEWFVVKPTKPKRSKPVQNRFDKRA